MIKLRNILVLLVACQFGWSQSETLNIDTVFEKALSYHYVNRDSAYYFYEKTIQLADKQNNLDYLLGSLGYLINANNNFYDLEGFSDNILRMDKLLYHDKRVEDFYLEKYYKDRLLFDKGNYHYKLKEYATSQKFFLELYNKIKTVPENELEILDIETMSGIYSFLGLIYRHTGKYEQAEYYFKKDIEWISTYKDSLDDWQSALYNTKKLLSQVYEIQNKSDSANDLLQESLQFYRSKSDNPRYRNNFLTTCILLAKNFLQRGDYVSAISVMDNNVLGDFEDNKFSKEIDVLYGDIYLKKNEYKKSEGFYKKALKDFQIYRQNQPHQDIAEVYGKIAEFYLKQKEYQKGIETIIKAFNVSGKKIEITGFDENPNPTDVFSKTQLLQFLDLKLQLLQGSYAEKSDVIYQETALQTNRDILKTFDQLKSEFDSKLDKQFLAEKVYPIFHRMLEISHAAYEKNRSTETLQLALNIAEKNKDFLLLEALRNSQATQYGDVPKKVLDKEAQLRAEITNLEKQMFDATESENGYSDALFKHKQEYFGFLDSLKTKYPKYHELKYQNRTLNLATIRENILDDNGALLSFTMTENHLYAIIMNGSKENFLELSFNENDREAVRKFYRLLSSPSINDVEIEISEAAQQLFEKTLKETLVGFDSENLTIIPDGELHYLPFDLLQKNGSYLLETKSISYGNSVTSLLELKEKKSAEANRILAYAPSFSGISNVSSDRQFGKLLYNDDEVSKISGFYDTETVLDKNATLNNFISEASQYNIFHLATHASANDEYPDYSYLAFSETNDSADSNILYIKDLYNMNLTADMVTLSACQTGIGKLQKGQGMLSLSKGFYYAGAKSLVNTLWKINDKSTVKLMTFFYEGLSKGKSKSKALRDAKLKYLSVTDDNLLRHPYYWSAFIVSGDIAPLTKNYFWWYIVTCSLVLMVFGAYIYFNRKRKATINS